VRAGNMGGQTPLKYVLDSYNGLLCAILIHFRALSSLSSGRDWSHVVYMSIFGITTATTSPQPSNTMIPTHPRLVKFLRILLLVTLLSGGYSLAQSPAQQAGNATGPSNFSEGVRYVDGKPYFSRAAFFGYNHWMSPTEEKSLGNFMAIPLTAVGTKRDYYSSAGFNTGYYSIWGHTWLNGKAFDPALVKDAFVRAKKAGQKVIIHLPVLTPESVTKEMGFVWVTEDGEKIPFGSMWGIFHDPELQAQAMKKTYQQVFDAVKDDPANIGYQLGAERWAYDYVRLKKEVSYDDYSLDQFRSFLKKRFTLEQVSLRYGQDKAFYKSWEEIFPPISKRPMDYARRELRNFDVARWDWYNYREKQTANVWVKMIETLQEMDGHGRPFSFEHGHGPYYSMGFHPFPEVCARIKNFSVGNGDFGQDLTATLSSMIQVKGCGKGPWINNELDAGTSNRYLDAADLRRKIWGTTALGAGGFHLWTFFNLMGASSEFTTETYVDPKLYDNMPPKYFEAQHSNKMLESLGQTLAGSTSPSPRVALLLLDDSLFLNTFVSDYRHEGVNFCRALTTRGLADDLVMYTKYHLDETPMDGIRSIVLPRMPRLTEDRAAKLAGFVERGGTLILMGPTAKINEAFEKQASFPYGVLGTASGINMNDLTPAENSAADIAADWNGRTIHIDVQTKLKIPNGSKAEVIATSGGQPVAVRNRYGKGIVYTLAGYPIVTEDSDPTGDFVAAILAEGGVTSAVSVKSGNNSDAGVFAAYRKGPNGSLVFLIENANKSHELDVTLDPVALGLDPSKSYSVFECFSEEAHKVSKVDGYHFSTELEPVGVRAYLVTEKSSLDEVIPKAQRYLVPRDPDFVLFEKAARGQRYYTGSALQEASAWARGRTIDAQEVGSESPLDLGDGFFALDLKGFCNAPLQRMLKNIKEAAFINYGNTAESVESGASLGFKTGKNTLGGVPFLSSGRYIAMQSRSAITSIPVNKKLASLSFFHGAQLGQDASTIGYYRIWYSDGSTQTVPIVVGVTLADFDRQPRFLKKTQLVTTVTNNGKKADLQRYDWKNPYPDKEIVSIDISANPTEDLRNFAIWAITAKAHQ